MWPSGGSIGPLGRGRFGGESEPWRILTVVPTGAGWGGVLVAILRQRRVWYFYYIREALAPLDITDKLPVGSR